MAIQLPPIPNNPITDTHVWRDWFFKVSQVLVQGAAIAWTSLNFSGSNIRDIQTRQHNALQDLQGGDGATQYYHLTQAQYNSLTPDYTYGAYQNNADQNLVTADTATVVVFNTLDYQNNMSLASNRVTIATAGIYNVQFSLQLANTDAAEHAAVIWLRRNGTDIPGTASKFDVPKKHGSSDGYLIAAVNFYVDVTVGQYIELVIACDGIETGASDGIYIEAYAVQTVPYARPSIPSSVITLTQVA
jgi:hypothetical protein